LAQAFATVPRSLASCLVALSVAPMDPLWGNDPWDAARRVPPASPRREALLHARSGEPMSGGACDDPRLRAARALMFETVSAGAPRQTAAAVAAALWRLLAGTPSADHRVIEPMVGTYGDDLELKDRLAAVSDVLQAQLAASRAGLPAHSCQGLVDHATKVKRNVALHGFGDLGDRFSALSPAELRRLQRGQPRPPKVHASSPAPAPGSPLHGCVDAPAIGGLARPGPPALGQVCAVVGDWQVVASLVSGMGFGCPQPPVASAPSAFGAAASATAPASQSEVSEECNEVEVGVESQSFNGSYCQDAGILPTSVTEEFSLFGQSDAPSAASASSGQGGAPSAASASFAEEAEIGFEKPSWASRKKMRRHRKRLAMALNVMPKCDMGASATCPECHPLVEHNGENEDEYRFCDSCGARDLEYTWSCFLCDHDICIDCHDQLVHRLS